MEEGGWAALEDEGHPAALHAVSQRAWPQEPNPDSCLRPVRTWKLTSPWWTLRTHSAEGGANFHANQIAGTPPLETYAPWTWASDEVDTITLYRACDPLD